MKKGKLLKDCYGYTYGYVDYDPAKLSAEYKNDDRVDDIYFKYMNMYCGFEEAYRNEKEMFDSNLKYVITEVLPKKSKCFTKEYFENHWIPTFCQFVGLYFDIYDISYCQYNKS